MIRDYYTKKIVFVISFGKKKNYYLAVVSRHIDD